MVFLTSIITDQICVSIYKGTNFWYFDVARNKTVCYTSLILCRNQLKWIKDSNVTGNIKIVIFVKMARIQKMNDRKFWKDFQGKRALSDCGSSVDNCYCYVNKHGAPSKN